MNNVINNFFKEIEDALEKFNNDNAVASFDDVESYFLEKFNLIENENEEIAQMGFDLQSALSELESGIDNRKILEEIQNIYTQMKNKWKGKNLGLRINDIETKNWLLNLLVWMLMS